MSSTGAYERRRHRPLCRTHVVRNLVVPHDMVPIPPGSLCEWCQTEDKETPADYLVDLRVPFERAT